MKAFQFFMTKGSDNLHDDIFSEFKKSEVTSYVHSGAKEKNNPLIFVAVENFIVFRSPILDPKINGREEVLDVKQGDLISLTVNLPSGYRKGQPSKVINGKKISPRGKFIVVDDLYDSNLIDYFQNLFIKSGLKDIKLTSVSYIEPLYVSALRMPVDVVEVVANAHIEDLELFEKAWINGIGRLKTYGFGMIRASKK